MLTQGTVPTREFEMKPRNDAIYRATDLPVARIPQPEIPRPRLCFCAVFCRKPKISHLSRSIPTIKARVHNLKHTTSQTNPIKKIPKYRNDNDIRAI